MSQEIFSNEKQTRWVEELGACIVKQESVVIHRMSKNEAQQRSFYRLLHNPHLKTVQVVEFMRSDCAPGGAVSSIPGLSVHGPAQL